MSDITPDAPLDVVVEVQAEMDHAEQMMETLRAVQEEHHDAQVHVIESLGDDGSHGLEVAHLDHGDHIDHVDTTPSA